MATKTTEQAGPGSRPAKNAKEGRLPRRAQTKASATTENTVATMELAAGAQDAIRVRGARVHNLKNIDFEIPHNAITVVSGVSGSGKSSLAFDTIYAEGQRRYIESLSAYARQFLERIEKPDVDEVTGIAPAIAIRQKNSTRNPRSTVATSTEIYDYLRLLYARVGHTFCVRCGEEVKKDSIDEIAERVLALPTGRRFYVLYTLVLQTEATETAKTAGAGKAARTGFSAKVAKKALPVAEAVKRTLGDLQKRGFSRLYQEGRVYEFSSPETLLDVDFAKPVHVLADRLALGPEIRSRLKDSIEICYREGRGEAILEFAPEQPGAAPERMVFSERFECKKCGIAYQEPEPRLFSFNNPYGACPRCQGFGNTIDFDIDRVIPDKGKSLAEGAVEPWTRPRFRQIVQNLKAYATKKGISLTTPFRQLTEQQKKWIIEGDRKEDWSGVTGFFAWLERKKYKLHVRVFLSRYRGYATCPDCQGTRLRPEARAVRVAGKSITEACEMTVAEARKFFSSLKLSTGEAVIAGKVLEEVQQRLRFLDEVGLDYLTLDRLTSTLSGGESQRIQLATSLGSHLVGALYVLDEPSIGLHPRDTHRLISILKSLRELGNTLLVVEHDADTIRAADYVMDLGPGAGEHGGKILFAGTQKQLETDTHSLTGRYLSGELHIPVPATRRKTQGRFLKILKARSHNLKEVDLMVPLNMIVTITGVSGSGKSTLVHDVIYKTLQAKRNGGNWRDACDDIQGDGALTAVEMVDQSPIGRTPRSNPATYLKAFDAIRELFASTPDAKKRGYAAGHFSFNIPGGRCEACQGDGTVTVEMRFLADVELICEECRGTRYKSGVLEVHYHGKNVHDVLQMTVHEAMAFFAGAPKVTSKLKVLEEVGLGYLRLGQSASTLSGGEAQRLKLAAHLTRQENTGVLYIFDEPTTGLHFDDISKLLAAFRKLLEGGASVLIIEHNLDVIKSADWVIDLGPEGGERGGRLVACGTPEQVARNAQSYTGKFLAKALEEGMRNGRNGHNGRQTPVSQNHVP
ncbi:MAG TPA: excinuclease ABC subunit UvrA [Candidatus Acidoferrales bacterium]|nr:excinuclease ABC subunit UvrA [Candidatus Acidoferrales bacterium]